MNCETCEAAREAMNSVKSFAQTKNVIAIHAEVLISNGQSDGEVEEDETPEGKKRRVEKAMQLMKLDKDKAPPQWLAEYDLKKVPKKNKKDCKADLVEQWWTAFQMHAELALTDGHKTWDELIVSFKADPRHLKAFDVSAYMNSA